MPERLKLPDEVAWQMEQAVQRIQAPPVQQTAEIETVHGITRVPDTVSRALISKSNAFIANNLKRALSDSMKLAKTVFGSVGKVFTAFNGLKRIVGGL